MAIPWNNPSVRTSSDVNAGDDALATDYNKARADILTAFNPPAPIISINDQIIEIFLAQFDQQPFSMDDRDIWAYAGALTKIRVLDMRSGGDYEERVITDEWVDADFVRGLVVIGSFLYVLLQDDAAPLLRIYRYTIGDLASGGTLMTWTPAGTSAARMYSNGTDLYIGDDGGGGGGINAHKFKIYTISGTTLTLDSSITCGADTNNFTSAAVDGAGNFYGYKSSDDLVRRYDSAGTLDATQTILLPNGTKTLGVVIEGIPYIEDRGVSPTIHTFTRVPLLP